MNVVHALIRDLVEKRLWPIAVILVVALVAVPVVIGGGDDGAGEAPLSALPTDEENGSAKVAAVELVGPASVRTRSGPSRDPFRRPSVKKASATTAPGKASATAPAGGGTSSPIGPGPGPVATPKPLKTTTPVGPVYYRTAARWYENDPGKPAPLARLTPLGGLTDPAALYLGVTKSDALYAVFVLGPNATSEGEGRCEDPANCRVFGLQAGRTQIITVHPADGSAERQFTLEATAVKAVTTNAATARTMRIKARTDGRDLMRELWKDVPTAQALAAVNYEQTTGLVVATAPAKSTE